MNKKLLLVILAIALFVIAGVSLVYYLKDAEFTIAWKLPFIHETSHYEPITEVGYCWTTRAPGSWLCSDINHFLEFFYYSKEVVKCLEC
jgi:hypothetical protein